MEGYVDITKLLDPFDSTLIYPVHSIYITKGDENPAIIIGGTWELIDNHLFLGLKIYERMA